MKPTRDFNPRKPRTASFEQMRALIEPGDLAQFRGRGYLSGLIQAATGGPHSHSAILDRRGPIVEVLELREFRGGRISTLAEQVARYPGRIDVFRLATEYLPRVDLRQVADTMRILAARRYGYRGLLRVALRRIPGLWRFYRPSTIDDPRAGPIPARAFCSHGAAIAFGRAGLDPVPRLPDHLTTPNDLTHSLAFDYLCTLGGT